MRYPIEERLCKKRQESRRLDHELGKMYLDSDSIEDFTVKADLANMPKPKVFLLVSYYNIRQRKTLARTIAFISGLLLTTSICLGLEACCHVSRISGYFGFLICGTIVGTVVGVGLLASVNIFLDSILKKFNLNC